MNSKVKGILKNFSYSFAANITSTLISMVLVAFVPKLLGQTEYSYWQLYVFYTGYVGFFHFGLADGIYLRYGGKEYDEVPKPLFHFQFWTLVCCEILLAIVMSLFVVFLIPNSDKILILLLTALCCVLVLPRTMLQYVLQGTNRIKEYARNLMIEKVIYGSLVVIVLALGFRNYEYLLLADIIAKTVTLFTMCLSCKDIVIQTTVSFKEGIREVWNNISVGIKLMFSNIAGMLIVGVVRFSIEQVWSVETFGKVSLSMSVSNLMMLFITAVSVVMFPLLKRTPQEKWADNYKLMRNILVIPLLGLLVLYYPAKVILSAWLPQYEESLRYMALMFPMCLYEGKMSMLINTYMKAMRMEKQMLLVNLISVTLSVLSTGLVIFLLKDLVLSVVSIMVLLAFRCILAELILAKRLSLKVGTDIVLEVLMTALFVVSNWYINSWLCVVVYAVGYLVYVFIRRKNIFPMVQTVKGMLKAK